MANTYSAGIVTAYGAAKRGGYTGTYDQFCADLARLADVLEEFLGFSVTIQTLAAGQQATASYENGVLSIGIPKGDTGNGIQSISLLSTVGLVKTYRITYTSGNYFDFPVADGKGIQSTVLNSDYTLTITYTDGTTWTSGSIRGQVGATPHLTIGTVETLPPSKSASATITGTDENPVLNLGIPKGDTGEVSQSEFDALSDDVDDLTRQLSDFEDEVDGKADNFSDITGYQLDITNRFNFISGVGIEYSNGTTYSNAYASCSDFIDVSEFDHVYFTIRHVSSKTRAGVAFYSDSKSFIRGVQELYGGVQANTYTHYWTYIGNAHYIRVTWYPSTSPDYNSFEFVGLKAGNYQWTQNLARANKGITGVVDYWGENLNIEPYLSDGSAATTVGIIREGEYVTLNKKDITSSDVRVKLDKLLGRATTAKAFTSYAKEIPFVSGHKYRFKVEYISGESSTGHNAPLFIRDTTNTSVLSLRPGDIKDFTWQDGNGTIMLWVDRNALYTDYKFRLSITDLTIAGNDSEITTIKDKYTNELSTTVASAIEKCDEPCLIFPLVTDIHYVSDPKSGYLFDDSVNNIRAFSKKVNCNGLICLGDMTDGGQGSTQPQSESAAITFVDILMKKMQSIGLPIFFSVGNHDDCRYMSNGFSAGQIYAYYMKQAEQNIMPDLDPLSLGTNYYKDFDGYNTRLICINTNILPTGNDKGAYGITDHTISWLTEVLNDMPNDYIGMIIAHEPLKDGLLWPNVATVQNAAAACDVIANCGKTCFVVTGHTHFDASLKDDFLSVVIASNRYTPEEEDYEVTTKGGITAYQYKRTSADYTEDLWDVLILRPRSKKLDFIRFGAGIDREFDIS